MTWLAVSLSQCMSSESALPQSFTSVGSLSNSGTTIYACVPYPSGEPIENHLQRNSAVLREILTYVESIEYDCECGLASGVSILRTNIDNTPKVKELIELCKDRVVAVFILGHMLDLTTRPIDMQYRNPWEHAMTTYLHAVTQARPDLKLPALTIARRLRNAYWPIQYISKFLE